MGKIKKKEIFKFLMDKGPLEQTEKNINMLNVCRIVLKK